jgi:hypothetical protein
MALLHRKETNEEWRRRIFAEAEELLRRHPDQEEVFAEMRRLRESLPWRGGVFRRRSRSAAVVVPLVATGVLDKDDRYGDLAARRYPGREAQESHS